jgi:hypothetical protein
MDWNVASTCSELSGGVWLRGSASWNAQTLPGPRLGRWRNILPLVDFLVHESNKCITPTKGTQFFQSSINKLVYTWDKYLNIQNNYVETSLSCGLQSRMCYILLLCVIPDEHIYENNFPVHIYMHTYYHVFRVVTNNNGFWIRWLGLLTFIRLHISRIQAIIALSLFYTLYSSPLHTH